MVFPINNVQYKIMYCNTVWAKCHIAFKFNRFPSATLNSLVCSLHKNDIYTNNPSSRKSPNPIKPCCLLSSLQLSSTPGVSQFTTRNNKDYLHFTTARHRRDTISCVIITSSVSTICNLTRVVKIIVMENMNTYIFCVCFLWVQCRKDSHICICLSLFWNNNSPSLCSRLRWVWYLVYVVKDWWLISAPDNVLSFFLSHRCLTIFLSLEIY